jgi:Trk K+ transport system NAD-binding subunit
MLGIDVTVSSTNLILEQIEEKLPTHLMSHLLTLEDGNLEIVEVNVQPGAAVVGKKISEIVLPAGSLICLIINSARGAQVPTGSSTIEAGDHIIAVTQPEHEAELRTVLTG